jgi:hypothetical protein
MRNLKHRKRPTSNHDEQLMFDRQRFCCHCAKTARPGKLCQGHQQMGDQDEHFSHESEL